MENDVVTTGETTLANTFNKHCIIIVGISNGKTQKNLLKMSPGKSKREVFCDILNAYKIHSSIKQIEKKFNKQNFSKRNIFL